MMLRCLQVFCEGLNDVLDKETSFHDWNQEEFSPEECAKRKAAFERVSFFEIMVNIYTLLNELNYHGWNKWSENLLTMVKEVYSSSATRSGKHKLNDELKAVIDCLLVREMVTLLKSIFDTDEPHVGTCRSTHNQLLARLITDVATAANPSVKRSILREMERLPFPNSKYVRKAFHDFFHYSGKRLTELAHGHMATSLEIVGFHRYSSTDSSDSDTKESTQICSWKTFSCTIDHKEAEGAMYCPKADCLAGNELRKCLSKHPNQDESCTKSKQNLGNISQRHKRNLDMLQKLSIQCPHLVQLHSYQISPFPFYITEQVSKRRLLTHILAHRDAQLWLHTPTLVLVMKDILKALLFLCERNIDPRGVNAYNTIVQPGAGADNRRQSSGAWCSVLTGQDFIVKLGNLELAHEYIEKDPVYNDCNLRPADNQGAVPVRWTSPEALFEGRYSEKNMVYNAGCIMHELWTHGCQPFSSYDNNMSTEDILKQMLTQPGSIKLSCRPCIPVAVYDLIQQCTHHKPDQRLSLQDVMNKLSHLSLMEQQDIREPELEKALSLSMKYPPISQCQEDRIHVPETGIPPSVQVLIDAGKNSAVYYQACRSTWVTSRHTVVARRELLAQDWIRIQHEEQRTVVEEVLSTEFVRDALPSLRANNQYYGLTCHGRTEDGPPKLEMKDGLTVNKRVYPASISLEWAARKGWLWDDEHRADTRADKPTLWLFPLISLAGKVTELHEKGLILCCLKETHILINSNTGEVMLPRIGRMYRLPSAETHVVREVFEDCRRWLAPEVLLNGQYGKENDVFMLGTVMQQVFRINEISKKNPAAEQHDFAPCSNIEKKQVESYARDPNRKEQKFDRCPVWLHELTARCRHVDPAARPSARQVHETLREHLESSVLSTPFPSGVSVTSTTGQRNVVSDRREHPWPDPAARTKAGEEIMSPSVRSRSKTPLSQMQRTQRAGFTKTMKRPADVNTTHSTVKRQNRPLPDIPCPNPDQTFVKTYANAGTPSPTGHYYAVLAAGRGIGGEGTGLQSSHTVLHTAGPDCGTYANQQVATDFGTERMGVVPSKLRRKEQDQDSRENKSSECFTKADCVQLNKHQNGHVHNGDSGDNTTKQPASETYPEKEQREGQAVHDDHTSECENDVGCTDHETLKHAHCSPLHGLNISHSPMPSPPRVESRQSDPLQSARATRTTGGLWANRYVPPNVFENQALSPSQLVSDDGSLGDIVSLTDENNVPQNKTLKLQTDGLHALNQREIGAHMHYNSNSDGRSADGMSSLDASYEGSMTPDRRNDTPISSSTESVSYPNGDYTHFAGEEREDSFDTAVGNMCVSASATGAEEEYDTENETKEQFEPCGTVDMPDTNHRSSSLATTSHACSDDRNTRASQMMHPTVPPGYFVLAETAGIPPLNGADSAQLMNSGNEESSVEMHVRNTDVERTLFPNSESSVVCEEHAMAASSAEHDVGSHSNDVDPWPPAVCCNISHEVKHDLDRFSVLNSSMDEGENEYSVPSSSAGCHDRDEDATATHSYFDCRSLHDDIDHGSTYNYIEHSGMNDDIDHSGLHDDIEHSDTHSGRLLLRCPRHSQLNSADHVQHQLSAPGCTCETGPGTFLKTLMSEGTGNSCVDSPLMSLAADDDHVYDEVY